ncbi:MAG: hypothetical protein Q7S33_04575 [Nanoarchaeota archaeon]|nr:hypothetical protein [Nanoarchaeota archaeon]
MKEKGEMNSSIMDEDIEGPHKKHNKTSQKKLSQIETQELLIENFVGLQKAMTNMSIKFENLTDQMVKLLEIFELSARSFVKETSDKGNKDLLNKIDSLLDQNKTIAKGLILIEDQLRTSSSDSMTTPSFNFPSEMNAPKETQNPRPLPRI